MADTAYTYSIANDFPGGKVCATNLVNEIEASSIVTALGRIDIDPNGDNPDRIDIVFKAALSVEDKTTLDGNTTNPAGGLIAQHDSTPKEDVDVVSLENMGTLEHPEKEVQRVVVQPGRTGYYMCDRDIKINTGIVGDESFEDLKVNASDSQQVNWGEVSLVGCYKLDNGAYVECADQTDADANACLSIYDYVAVNQTTNGAIEYDFKGGCLWSDANLTEPVWEHRMYALMAPNIPAAMGGSVRFFDGYLYPYQGKWQEAVNSLSLKIDPSQTVEAARIRFWIYYPAGAKQNHVLRIITYRKPETN